MRIDRIDLYHVAMPLIYPWRTAYGDDHVIESVLVRMQSGDVVGWGETRPLAAPTYSPEWAAGVFHVAKTWLAPRLVGQDITRGPQLQGRLGLIKGNPFAKAGLDLAWCFLIVFLLYVLIAGLLAFIGVKKVKQVRAPERAIYQAQETKSILKRG